MTHTTQGRSDKRSERAVIDCLRASYDVIHAYTTTPMPAMTRELYSDACSEFNANARVLVDLGHDMADIAMMCALWSKNRTTIASMKRQRQMRKQS